MGKFEKGQYVRRTRGSSFLTSTGSHGSGFVGQIKTIVSASYGDDLVFTNGHRGIAFHYEPWVPKVGERVTTNGTARVNIERHWNHHFRRSEGEIINGALVVTSVADRASGSNIGLSNKDGRSLFFMPQSTLRPADPAPTTLAIEAGKFYKTRDGRKVGPMILLIGDYFCEMVGNGQSWKVDGSVYGRVGDPSPIIAEWIDEPKASNDNSETAKPKFNVGDIVRDTDSEEGSTGIVREVCDNGFTIEWLEDGVPSGTVGQWPYDDFVIALAACATPVIVALIEDGKVKPATRPKVHTDQATATTEAERLALAHPGQQFGVFVLADSKIADLITETVQRAVLRAA